jgi:aminopeptidase N
MATLINTPRDPNTLSNYNNFRCTHTEANFEILFEQKRLVGNVVHKLKSTTNAESKEIILDSSHVSIDEVQVNGNPAEWELLPPFGPLGTALKIKLDQPVQLDELVDVKVRCPCDIAPLRIDKLTGLSDLCSNNREMYGAPMVDQSTNVNKEASIYV